MPSAFPGMHPYVEHADVWQDFYQSVIALLRQMLSEQVRPSRQAGFVARWSAVTDGIFALMRLISPLRCCKARMRSGRSS
jgi:hypothetical protein